MEYRGRYKMFDVSKIKTYPLETRPSEVTISDLIDPERILNEPLKYYSSDLEKIARAILDAHKDNKPVVIMSGAHVVKNGLSPIYNEFIKQGIVDHIGVNGAFTIHDFELTFAGKTSESIPDALSKGLFGFAEETDRYLNDMLNYANKLKIGYGEALGRLISGEPFPEHINFKYPDISVPYNAYKHGIPFTVHVGVGTDIFHMHPNFDGESVGGCSGRDFLIFAQKISEMTEGGVCLLIGSAVIGVEVYLKAFSMAANIGKIPNDVVMADLDLRKANINDAAEDRKDKPTYYFRDIKSIVVRIPKAFNGRGYYIQGDQRDTLPALYKLVMENIKMS